MGERLAGEHCPMLPPGTRKVRWPLNDPAEDADEEIMAVFRATRDEINERVTGFIARPRDESAV